MTQRVLRGTRLSRRSLWSGARLRVSAIGAPFAVGGQGGDTRKSATAHGPRFLWGLLHQKLFGRFLPFHDSATRFHRHRRAADPSPFFKYLDDSLVLGRVARPGAHLCRSSKIIAATKASNSVVLPPKRPALNGCVERSQSSWRYEFYACHDLPARIDKLQPSSTRSPTDTITTDTWRSHPREYRNDTARRPIRLISAKPGHCAWIIPCGAKARPDPAQTHHVRRRR
jgi:hypothetical protein